MFAYTACLSQERLKIEQVETDDVIGRNKPIQVENIRDFTINNDV